MSEVIQCSLCQRGDPCAANDALKKRAKAPPPPSLDTPIDWDCGWYGLSVRTINVLRNYSPFDQPEISIRTIGDLQQFTDRELLRFKGMGKRGLSEVERLLEQCGGRLAGDYCPHCAHCRQREARKGLI